MNTMHRKAIAAAGLTAVAIFGAAACSSDPPSPEAAADEYVRDGGDDLGRAESDGQPPGANLVGTGCAAYAEQVPSGPGSVAGMAQDPVAVAASNNPMLTTLTSALSGKLNPGVNLVDTLNSNPGLTVFAPTNDAFAKIDAATIEKLKTDSDLLSGILTYHVVAGQASPSAVVGDHKTVEGGSVTVTGSGESPEVQRRRSGVRWRARPPTPPST